MDKLGLSEIAKINFLKLSLGQQRLTLLARALVKSPSLLILDEACDGLDMQNRNKIERMIDDFVYKNLSQIIYISHREENNLSCLTHELKFIKKNNHFVTKKLELI